MSLSALEREADLRYYFKENGVPETCPKCQSDLTVYAHGAACPNTHCSFGAGSWFDFFPQETQSYIQATLPDSPQLRDMNWAGARVAHSIQRRLYDFFREAYLRGPFSQTIFEASFGRWLEKKNISRESVHGTWWVFSGHDMVLLDKLVTLYGKELPSTIDYSSACLVVPYWGNHHSISALRFIGPEGQNWGMLVLRRFRHTVAGIVKPLSEVSVDDHSSSHQGLPHLSLSPTFQHSCIMALLEDTGLHVTVSAGMHLPQGFRVVGDLHRKIVTRCNGVGLANFIQDTVYKAFERREPITRISRFLQECSLSRAQQHDLSAALENAGDPDRSQQVQEMCLTKIIQWENNSRIIQTPFCFMSGKSSSDVLTPITNFSWEPEAMVVFHDQPPMIRGQFQTRDVKQDIKVKLEDLESVGKFEAACRQQLSVEHVVTAYDRAAFSPILDAWRKDIGTIPRQIGFHNLGWSRDKTAFRMPGFVLSAKGYTEVAGDLIWHPIAEPLKDFSRIILRSPSTPPTNGEKTLMAFAAGNVARASRSSAPIPLSFPSEKKELLLQIFSCLGQTGVATSPANPRASGESFFSGYPVLTEAMLPSVLSSSRWPAWQLDDRSPSNLPGDLSDLCGWFVLQAVFQAATAILKGSSAPRRKSVDLLYTLIYEGTSVLGTQAPAKSTYPSLDRLFDSIVPEEFKSYVTLDYARHKLKILATGNSQDLTIEASTFCGKEAGVEGGYLVLPEVQGIQMVTNFFGHFPKPDVIV